MLLDVLTPPGNSQEDSILYSLSNFHTYRVKINTDLNFGLENIYIRKHVKYLYILSLPYT